MSETEQKEHLQGDQEIDAFLSINEINKELSRLFEKRMILEGKTKQKKIPTAAEVAKITQSLTNRSKERGHETFCSILPKTKDKTFDDFSSAINKAGIYSDFEIYPIPDPVWRFRSIFLDHLKDKGLSSLLSLTIFNDSIISSQKNIDDVMNLIIGHLKKLDGCNRLVIIDPYFYGNSGSDTLGILKTLMMTVSSKLQNLYIITDGKHRKSRSQILSCLNDMNINIQEMVNDELHDRFWIDPDSYTGVVFGTSLNGIGKKMALIDFLRADDTKEALSLCNIQ